MFLNILSSKEVDILVKKYQSKRYYRKCPSTDSYDMEMFRIDNLYFRIKNPIKLGLGSPEEWRERYYKHHFHVEENIDQFSKKLCEEYFRGLLWVSKYYFNRCRYYKY